MPSSETPTWDQALLARAYYSDDSVVLLHGDCLDVLGTLADASVDSVVTDPPYGLEFMGKEWDAPWKSSGVGRGVRVATERAGEFTPTGEGHSTSAGPYLAARVDSVRVAGKPFQAWCELWARECLRVLKPGGHLLAFGGTRTSHRLVCAIEDAGFEIRDSIAWLYGSGFPKSLDVSKAIDRAAGVEREVVGDSPFAARKPNGSAGVHSVGLSAAPGATVTAPATPEAERWQGWGTSMKPAHEPVVVARKPLIGTVAQNILAHGTGALNVDGCRIEMSGHDRAVVDSRSGAGSGGEGWGTVGIHEEGRRFTSAAAGRWPANVVLDEHQAAALDEQSGITTSNDPGVTHVQAEGWGHAAERINSGYAGDIGGASRFFLTVPIDDLDSRFIYTAKAGSDERPTYTKQGADGRVAGTPARSGRRCNICGNQTVPPGGKPWPACGHEDWATFETENRKPDTVSHPTVKPIALMRWLVRLVTPPGGTVLEPFAGSGTTAEACLLERFHCIAIEREADYLPLIVQRINRRRDPIAYLTDAGHDLGLFADEETA